MSSLAKNFNKITHVYRDIAKDVYDQTLVTVMHQLQHQIHDPSYIKDLLDLGCGDGTTLEKLHQCFPNAHCTGVDISENMLKKAATRLPLTTIKSDMLHLDKLLPRHQFDLILGHFVLGYIDLNAFLEKIDYLACDHSYCSITTNSDDSFSAVKNIVQNSLAKNKLISALINRKVNNGVKKSKNVIDWEQLPTTVAKHQFHVVAFEEIQIDCHFKSAHELFDFIFYGSWGIGELNPYIPLPLYRFFYKKLIGYLAEFPFTDTVKVKVALLKRNNIAQKHI